MTKGKKRAQSFSDNVVKEHPTYVVLVPYKEHYVWPNCCVLCCSPNTVQERSLSVPFKSGEYLIVHQSTTLTIPGMKICANCIQRLSFSKNELIFILIGLAIGITIAIPLLAHDIDYLCGAIFAVILCLIGAYMLGRFVLPKKAEAQPVSVEVVTESYYVFKNRPNKLIFKFRNQKFADEFAKANGVYNLGIEHS